MDQLYRSLFIRRIFDSYRILCLPLYQMVCNYIEARYTPSFPYALLFMVGVFIVSVMADKVRLFIYKHTLLKLLK